MTGKPPARCGTAADSPITRDCARLPVAGAGGAPRSTTAAPALGHAGAGAGLAPVTTPLRDVFALPSGGSGRSSPATDGTCCTSRLGDHKSEPLAAAGVATVGVNVAAIAATA